MTKSQIDRLGARLRAGVLSDADLRLLDEYRRSFAGAYGVVMGRLSNELSLDPTGRAAKSTPAIVSKLQRESVRLSQIQDIAGCRVVVRDVPAQDDLVGVLTSAFEMSSVIDRRERPSYGYRAVHLVVMANAKVVEIQVRTAAQQFWAEISEKLGDRLGMSVKYGDANGVVREFLETSSNLVGIIGQLETTLVNMGQVHASSPPAENATEYDETARTLEFIRAELRQIRDNFVRRLG